MQYQFPYSTSDLTLEFRDEVIYWHNVTCFQNWAHRGFVPLVRNYANCQEKIQYVNQRTE